jgi:hypothetical protein
MKRLMLLVFYFALLTEVSAQVPPLKALTSEASTFNAKKTNEGVALEWITIASTDISHFNIQLSIDQLVFNTIATVKAEVVDVNSEEPIRYFYLDSNPKLEDNFYRIQQINKDSSITYSHTVKINWPKSEQKLTLYPNPVQANLKLNIDLVENALLLIEIIDIKGSIMQQLKQQMPSGFNQLSIPTNVLSNGIYLIQVKENGEVFSQQKFEKVD